MARTGHKSKDTAKALYLKGIPQERIIEMTGIARQTLSRWISQEGWRELKACYGMTREEVTQKILSIINDAIEDPDEYLKKKKIADDLVKLAATIEKMEHQCGALCGGLHPVRGLADGTPEGLSGASRQGRGDAPRPA